MRIMGIDPGLRLTGFACLAADAERRADIPAVLDAGVIRLRRDEPVAARLVELERELAQLVRELEPDVACVEMLYGHGRRPTTAIIMAHARGVILMVLARAGVPVIELPATEVKKSLTGNGHAGKAQVQSAVSAVFGLVPAPSPADVADAIAVAYAGVSRRLSACAEAAERGAADG